MTDRFSTLTSTVSTETKAALKYWKASSVDDDSEDAEQDGLEHMDRVIAVKCEQFSRCLPSNLESSKQLAGKLVWTLNAPKPYVLVSDPPRDKQAFGSFARITDLGKARRCTSVDDFPNITSMLGSNLRLSHDEKVQVVHHAALEHMLQTATVPRLLTLQEQEMAVYSWWLCDIDLETSPGDLQFLNLLGKYNEQFLSPMDAIMLECHELGLLSLPPLNNEEDMWNAQSRPCVFVTYSSALMYHLPDSPESKAVLLGSSVQGIDAKNVTARSSYKIFMQQKLISAKAQGAAITTKIVQRLERVFGKDNVLARSVDVGQSGNHMCSNRLLYHLKPGATICSVEHLKSATKRNACKICSTYVQRRPMLPFAVLNCFGLPIRRRFGWREICELSFRTPEIHKSADVPQFSFDVKTSHEFGIGAAAAASASGFEKHPITKIGEWVHSKDPGAIDILRLEAIDPDTDRSMDSDSSRESFLSHMRAASTSLSSQRPSARLSEEHRPNFLKYVATRRGHGNGVRCTETTCPAVFSTALKQLVKRVREADLPQIAKLFYEEYREAGVPVVKYNIDKSWKCLCDPKETHRKNKCWMFVSPYGITFRDLHPKCRPKHEKIDLPPEIRQQMFLRLGQ